MYYNAIHPIYVPKPPVTHISLSFSILSNCMKYVSFVYPQAPSTSVILKNLTTEGEIGVLYYPDCMYDDSVPGCYHYVTVLSNDGETVTFSETHYFGNTKSTRILPYANFLGFYKLP